MKIGEPVEPAGEEDIWLGFNEGYTSESWYSSLSRASAGSRSLGLPTCACAIVLTRQAGIS
jgi:hypothetical protein